MPENNLFLVIVLTIYDALITHKFPNTKPIVGVNNGLKSRIDFTEIHKFRDFVYRNLQFGLVYGIWVKSPYPLRSLIFFIPCYSFFNILVRPVMALSTGFKGIIPPPVVASNNLRSACVGGFT